jgi:hypothetical protein
MTDSTVTEVPGGAALHWPDIADWHAFYVMERGAFEAGCRPNEPEEAAFKECAGAWVVAGVPYRSDDADYWHLQGIFVTVEAALDYAEVRRVEAALS